MLTAYAFMNTHYTGKGSRSVKYSKRALANAGVLVLILLSKNFRVDFMIKT